MKLLDWLFSSRYIAHLEAELVSRLAEKDALIRQLRIELAEVKAMRYAPPLAVKSFAHPDDKLSRPLSVATVTPQDWQAELTKLLQEEEDGIRSGGRVQEHESRAHDGA